MLKQKTCKACRKKFTPSRPMQTACSTACAIAIAERKREKQAQQMQGLPASRARMKAQNALSASRISSGMPFMLSSCWRVSLRFSAAICCACFSRLRSAMAIAHAVEQADCIGRVGVNFCRHDLHVFCFSMPTPTQ